MRVVLVLLGALVLAAPAGSTGTSGLYGIVRRGPTTPVCRVGEPCSAPTKAELRFIQNGVRVAVAHSGSDGRYRVALPLGRYRVQLATKPAIGRGLEPQSVIVPRGRFARVNFMIDTGIR